jgi:UDP-glucose 4-epimerase
LKTALITGVAGFLGRHVLRQFSREGWRVIGLDDVPPENAPKAENAEFHRVKLPDAALAILLRDEKPDVCVHCAGRASVALSIEDPAADFAANTTLTFELLDLLRRESPRCRFLFLSSAAVYGNPESLPIAEDAICAPLSPYGYHKRQGELLCEEFARIYGLPTASARIFSAYGPGLRRQVVWDICERVLTTGSLTLRGTGEESRDFIHAADVARALFHLAQKAPCEGEIYNVASGVEITLKELAERLVAALGSSVQPRFDGTTPTGDPRNWRADVRKLHELGFAPTIPLAQGIQAVAAWARAELVLA